MECYSKLVSGLIDTSLLTTSTVTLYYRNIVTSTQKLYLKHKNTPGTQSNQGYFNIILYSISIEILSTEPTPLKPNSSLPPSEIDAFQSTGVIT